MVTTPKDNFPGCDAYQTVFVFYWFAPSHSHSSLRLLLLLLLQRHRVLPLAADDAGSDAGALWKLLHQFAFTMPTSLHACRGDDGQVLIITAPPRQSTAKRDQQYAPCRAGHPRA